MMNWHLERVTPSTPLLSSLTSCLMTRLAMAAMVFVAIANAATVSWGEEHRPDVTQSDAPPPQLAEYIAQPDPEFRWSLEETVQTPLGKVYCLHLVSQKWHDIVWEHALLVYEPETLIFPNQMMLFVTGGSNGKIPQVKEYPLGLQLAELSGARVAMLHQVPNQPLLGNRKEDDLISETWLRYLQTGDATWPLLFPMVKSATRAMDALQLFSRQQFHEEVDSFVITGASKRGWTTWLASAVDRRIIAAAPMVIDILNFPEQMKHQKETWGFYSEQISDYTSKGLIQPDGIPRAGREHELWTMMDPYSYRNQITIPKLLIVGANDRYWSVDAMSIYWNDLKGPTAQHRVPNAGHNLDNGSDGRLMALQTLAVFFRLSARGQQFPRITCEFQSSDEELQLDFQSTVTPDTARLWSCTAPIHDFREATWSAQKVKLKDNNVTGTASLPPGEHAAMFGEMVFKYDDIKYSLTTLVHWK